MLHIFLQNRCHRFVFVISVDVHPQRSLGRQQLAALNAGKLFVLVLALDVLSQIVFRFNKLVADETLPEKAAEGRHDRVHVRLKGFDA